MTKQLVRVLTVIACAWMMALIATPAQAQSGSLKGKVVDEAGKPVADVEITLDFVGDYVRQYKVKTDSKGLWIKAGMPSGGGVWTLTAAKGDLTGQVKGVRVAIGEMTTVPDVTIKAGGARADTAKLSNDEIEKRNKKQKELEQLFTDANTAIEAGNLDEAITKLTQMTTEIPTCAACFAKLGDIYVKKNDLANAETAYLKAIEIDPAQAGPYNALASVYNSQKKFDEAAKMSAKANELGGASPTGNNAESVYNQGIIFWNQGKIAEAKAQFAKAIELDPKMADAQYLVWHGARERRQAARREEAIHGVPEARTDRSVRRHGQGDARDDQVAMPPSAVVAEQLDTVRRRLSAAAQRANRNPSDIQLVAVSKTFGPELVREAAAAGQRHFGENRVQEGLDKIGALRDLPLDWHLIGHLQSNKARKAAEAFAWIESVDSLDLLKRLDQAAVAAGTRPTILVQVDLAHEATKFGADEREIGDLVKAALDARALTLAGLMTVPPFPTNPEDSRPWFRRLREVRDDLVASGAPASRLTQLSMGMSHDFEVAIEEGATIVRVGTAIFGRRVPAPAEE